MTRATDLTDALESALAGINPANGYATDVKAVYGFGKAKRDSAPLPCLLVRITEDSADRPTGKSSARRAQYEIEGVFPRTASLQDLQRCHHDILRALGYGSVSGERPVGPIEDDSAEFDPEPDSPNRRVVSRLTLRYVELY